MFCGSWLILKHLVADMHGNSVSVTATMNVQYIELLYVLSIFYVLYMHFSSKMSPANRIHVQIQTTKPQLKWQKFKPMTVSQLRQN